MPKHIGVRGRLLLAFLGISAFAVLAAAAGKHSFLKVGEALAEYARPGTVGRRMLQLAAQAERILATSPALVAVRSKAEHQAVSVRINGEAERLSDSCAAQGQLDAGCRPRAPGRPGRRPEARPRNARRGCLRAAGIVQRELGSLQEAGRHNAAVRRLLGPAAELLNTKRAQLEQTIAAGDPSLLSDAKAVRVARK